MLALVVIWLQFLGLGAVIAVAGFHLCREGDRIGVRLGLSGSWVGLAMLATVTSLPELVTGVVAVSTANVPNIAVGDALGSCVINLAFLVLLDFLNRGEPIFSRVSQGHILSAGFGVVLIGFIGINIVVAGAPTGAAGSTFAPAGLTHVGLAHVGLAHVGLYSPLILLFYVIAMRTLFIYENTRATATPETGGAAAAIDLTRALRRFGLAAAAVVAAGCWLPFVGSDLAEAMGWNRSFVGTLFIAAVTSMPELAITVFALRMGAVDMAIGNLLGSNLFNCAIIALDDLIYTPGPLLSNVSPVHAATAFSAVIMTGLATIGLLYRPRGRVLRSVGWVSIGLAVLYLSNTYIVFLYGD